MTCCVCDLIGWVLGADYFATSFYCTISSSSSSPLKFRNGYGVKAVRSKTASAG